MQFSWQSLAWHAKALGSIPPSSVAPESQPLAGAINIVSSCIGSAGLPFLPTDAEMHLSAK